METDQQTVRLDPDQLDDIIAAILTTGWLGTLSGKHNVTGSVAGAYTEIRKSLHEAKGKTHITPAPPAVD